MIRPMLTIVIVGAGGVGRYMAELLSKSQHNVIVVDKNKAKLALLASQIDVATKVGSGTDWQVLDDLFELNPDVLLALTDSDETNLVACSIAKHLGYPKTVGRVRDSRYLNRTRLDFARLFNVDDFIGPEILVAQDVIKYMVSQGALMLKHFSHGAVQLRCCLVPDGWKKGEVPLNQLKLPLGLIVGLIKRGASVIFPHGTDTLLPGDEVTFIGESDKVELLPAFLGIHQKTMESVVVVGGSLVGYNLAKLLEKREMNARLIEKDYDKCVQLTELLPRTTIMHYDATDQDFIREEKLGKADLVAFCTNHDEVNILGGKLVKEAGKADVVVVLSNLSYQPIAKELGLNCVFSPKHSAANRILSHIMSGTVTSLISLYENQAEVMEIRVSASSKIVGIPLAELGPYLPRDFLIAMIQNRGRLMAATGAKIISPGDTVIVITNPKHVPELEKIF